MGYGGFKNREISRSNIENSNFVRKSPESKLEESPSVYFLLMRSCSASLLGGNQDDGSPPALHTEATPS